MRTKPAYLGICLLLLGSLTLQTGCARTTAPPVPAPTKPAEAPKPPERRILLTVLFDFDDYKVKPESFSVLSNLAAALKDDRLRGVSYEVNGHTDLRGTLGYNITLSKLRAGSVIDFLRNSGVVAPPILAQGFGPLQLLLPAYPFNPANRRVEIVATGP